MDCGLDAGCTHLLECEMPLVLLGNLLELLQVERKSLLLQRPALCLLNRDIGLIADDSDFYGTKNSIV